MKKIYIEIKWAFIYSITLLAWMLLENTLGWHQERIADQWWLTLLFIPFAVFIYLLAVREKRRRVYDRKMTWPQAFLLGAILSVFIALLTPISSYIINNYITPELFFNAMDYSTKNVGMTQSDANEYVLLTTYLWQSPIGALIFGLVTAAIVALFVRKK